jgi:Flp pilus assembly protein TadG
MANKRKGQGLVEFALILPVILLLFCVIIESGRIFHAYTTVQHAAR